MGTSEPAPSAETIAAIATLTNEALPNVEIRISDSLLPVLFEEECGRRRQRKMMKRSRQEDSNRRVQQQLDVLGLTAAPPDSPILGGTFS